MGELRPYVAAADENEGGMLEINQLISIDGVLTLEAPVRSESCAPVEYTYVHTYEENPIDSATLDARSVHQHHYK